MRTKRFLYHRQFFSYKYHFNPVILRLREKIALNLK